MHEFSGKVLYVNARQKWKEAPPYYSLLLQVYASRFQLQLPRQPNRTWPERVEILTKPW